MAKKIMLLIDPSASGLGDITTLLRIGKFLVSKGYEVFSTIVFQTRTVTHTENLYEKLIPIISREESIPSVVYPPIDPTFGKMGYKDLIKITKAKPSEFSLYNRLITDLDGWCLSWEILQEILKMKKESTMQQLSKLNQKVCSRPRKSVTEKNIDFEIAVYCSHRNPGKPKRILISQYGDRDKMNKLNYPRDWRMGGFDFIIKPVSPHNEKAVALLAGFHTYREFTVSSKKEVVPILTKNKKLELAKAHLKNSAWGCYYSGTLGTNGLFFKSLLSALPKLKKKHKKITYFTFQDQHHFKKYVLKYLKGEDVGIVDLISNEIVQDYLGKDVLFINLQVKSNFMEAIVSCCELCSVCAGDGSFNLLYNNLHNHPHFTFFKYFNYDQHYFFQFLVSKVHEYETKNNLNHDVSRCLFAFGYYEKIFKYHLKQESLGIIDNFKMLELEKGQSSLNIVKKFFQSGEDKALIERLFYDDELTEKFNRIMRELPAFIKEEDKLLPVEDVLISILKGKVKSPGRTTTKR